MKYGKLPFIFRSRFVAQLHVAMGILLLLGALSFAVIGVLAAKHIAVHVVGFAMFLVVGALGGASSRNGINNTAGSSSDRTTYPLNGVDRYVWTVYRADAPRRC